MKTFISLFICSILLFFCTAQTFAQNIQSISAKVLDVKQEALMGNAFALSVTDSSRIQAVSFTNGSFTLSGLHHSEILLKLSSLLFPDTLIKVKYNGQADINLGILTIRENKYQLAEVQIRSQQPQIKYTSNGNIEVNVANTILASSNSATELLSRAPNVIVTDGRFSVFGKGDAIIYLNGKQITYEQLAGVSSAQIAKVEIISNPSSKYDAEGKAVINIITKVNSSEGIIGSISQYLTSSKFGGKNEQSMMDLNYMKGKFSLAGNYNLQLGRTRERLYTTRTRPAETDYLRSELTTNWMRKMNNFSNYGFGAQYMFNSNSNLSLAYSGNLENLGGSQESQNAITTKKDNSFYTSNIAKDDLRYNNSLILNYNRTIDSLGSSFFAGSQYSRYNTDIHDFINENSKINASEAYRFLKNNVGSKLSISSTQADYAKVFPSRAKLEMGAKFSYVQTNSATEFFIAENGGDFKRNNVLSNDFKYTEKIPAAYLNYNGSFNEKLSYGLGLRSEWTSYELNTSVGTGQLLSDYYFNLFPNLFLGAALSPEFKLRASYVSKITRPRYQALNPFVIYQDPFTTIEGNPNLVPEKVHSFELGAIYKSFDFKVGYNYTIDPLSSAALRGSSPNSYVLKPINLDKDHTWYAALSASFNTSWWNSVNTVNLTYSRSIDNKFDFVQMEPKPQVYLYSSNTFNIRNWFKIQLMAWYLGDRYYGLYYNVHRSTVTAGLEKDFFNHSLKTSFTVNDIFHRTNAAGNYSVGQTDIYFNRTYSTNYFRLMVTYRFGRLKNSAFRNKQTGQAESSRAN
ncbi:outer membrane beta-barrel family protein [Pedobacter nutrimenti]|uniref:Outer membrane receptor protein involved in Fe transport n=1 Tax=Pedobacter nutrimenti TaxID=1241337 RepID=A0A318UFQ9_9SPHI|nr:outer membrane beta-barrel family protein [Pedobacter nutrimenti]PYF74963.1 outer membrane receptor protein involved in Fe transport [Pedobacter nutrimenti]